MKCFCINKSKFLTTENFNKCHDCGQTAEMCKTHYTVMYELSGNSYDDNMNKLIEEYKLTLRLNKLNNVI